MAASYSIIAAVLIGVSLSGCAASPWSGNMPLDATQATAKATPTPAPSDPQQFQNALAELQRLGPIDQAAHDQLLADLRQSDPAIWPLVIQQFRATQAYRQQALCHDGGPRFVQRLPAIDGKLPVTSSLQEAYPSTSAPSSDGVLPASYAAPPADDWRRRLNETIVALEAETPADPRTPADVAQHARLRLLYAAAGRREDAARPIPNASPATQQFLAKEIEGIEAWLNAEHAPDPLRRAAEAKPALLEALARLGETGPLLVRNAAFCTEVLGFGSVKRFDKNEFAADQEVLLYAELENFVSEPSPQGFHTSLRGCYEIVDALGRQVVRREFSAIDDQCKSPRRDFFVVYRFHLPRQLAQGKYMLRLVVQDAIGQKAGQASIEFTAKGKGEGGRGKGEMI
jgi:hypothetical protein